MGRVLQVLSPFDQQLFQNFWQFHSPLISCVVEKTLGPLVNTECVVEDYNRRPIVLLQGRLLSLAATMCLLFLS